MYNNYTCRAKVPAPIQDHLIYHLVWDLTEHYRLDQILRRVLGQGKSSVDPCSVHHEIYCGKSYFKQALKFTLFVTIPFEATGMAFVHLGL